MNESETCGPGGTNLTRPDSLDVHGIRSQLDALRAKHGAKTPKGHACSNLIELIERSEGYERPSWATHEFQTLPGLMKRQLAKLSAA